MATSSNTIEYIEDQLSGISDIRSRKMFGEYALYAEDKVVALVCDNHLFVKMTDLGRDYVGSRYQEGFPYPGAKVTILVDEEYIEDRHWLTELIRITADALPAPKPKKLKNNTKQVSTHY